MTQNNDAYKLELDVREFMATLQKAMVAYTAFGNKLKAALRIRIDDAQLRSLAGYIGKEFKSVAQVLVKDLKPAFAQVTKEAAKLDAAMSAPANTAAKTAKRVTQIWKSALVQIDNENVRVSARLNRASEAALNKLIRLQQKVKDQSKLVDENGRSTALNASNQFDLLAFNADKKDLSLNQVLIDKLRTQATRALEEQRAAAASLNRQRETALTVEREHAKANRIIAAEKAKDARESLKILEATTKMARAAERYKAATVEAAAAINHTRQMKGISGRVSPGELQVMDDMQNVVGVNRARIAEIRRQDQQAAAGVLGLTREQARYVKELERTHQGIITKLIKQGVHLAKFMILYRVMADAINLAQTAISTVVSQGIEYTKQVEIQRLGLRGILAENFNIEDSQGNQLNNAVAINALQGESVKQWQMLQASALSVVGTTADMMLLFNSILPFAARLGKDLGEVQKMTQATAIAASLMDISFQDARSAIISLLQGRALTRNRLVGAMGITKADIETAKEAGQTFDFVFKKLDGFRDLARDASTTVAALSEQFRELIGLVGKQFVAPFLDGFKRLMGEVGKGGIMGALFEGDGTSLRPKRETEAFFSFIRSQLSQAMVPLKEFTKELKEEGREGLMTYTMAARDAATAVLTVMTNLTKGTLALSGFIAQNRSLIKTLAWVGIISTGAILLNNFGARVLGVIARLGALKAISIGAAAGQGQLAVAVKGTTVATTAASASLGGLTGIIARLTAGGLVAGAITVIGLLAQKFFELREQAEGGKRAIQALAEGDVYGAIAEARAKIKSEDPQTRTDGLGLYGAGVDRLTKRFSELKSSHGILKGLANDGSNALDIYKGLNEQQAILNKQLEDGTAISREKVISDLGMIRSAKSALSDTFNQLAQFGVFGIGPLDREIKKAEEELETLMRQDVRNRTRQQKQASRGLEQEGVSHDVIAKFEDDVTAANLRKIEEANRRYKKLVDDRQKLVQALRRGNAFQVGAEKADELKMTPKPSADEDPDKDKRRDPFFSKAQDTLRRFEIEFETRQQIAQAFYDERITTEKQFSDQMEAIQVERIAASKRLADMELRQFRAFLEQQIKEKKVKPDDAKDELANFERDMANRVAQIEAEEKRLNAKRDARRQGSEIRVGDLAVEAASRIDQEIAQIFGNTEENVRETLGRIAKEIEDKFKIEGAPEKGKALASRLLSAVPDAAVLTESTKQYQHQQRILQNLREAHAQLADQQERGEITVSEYLQRSNANRQDQIRTLQAMAAALQNIITIGGSYGMSADEISRLQSELAGVNRELAETSRAATTLNQAFSGFVSLLSEIQGFSTVFDGFGQGLSSSLGLITNIVGQAGKLSGLKGTIDNFKKLWGSMGAQTAGGGVGKFFSMFSGGIGMKKQPNAAGGTDLVGSATSAALGMATFGVSAAIQVAGALFQQAVDKAKKNIQKSIDGISKSIASGAVTIGQGVANLEKERAKLVKQYSGSKSGRKALKELLPDIDSQIDQIKERIKSIRAGFDDALKNMRLGSGPFADFAKQLLDLEKFTKEYLDTFVKDTPDWFAAVAKVTEYFQIFLRNAKTSFQSSMLDFEGQAISAAERVISLMDEQKSLATQLSDILFERQELQKDMNELWKEELEHAEDLEEARKRIAEIMREAAETEAEIRRRGVLEAQLSVAERKANEIAALREATLEQIRDAQKELKELEGKDPVSERRQDLSRRASRLAESESQIRENQRLNEIRLRGAMQVARIEGGMFGLTFDRFALAERAANLEIRQANIQVAKWRETRALMEAIIDGANGFMFDPPEGFPAIRVQIGNIVINNQDQSNNVVQVPPPPRVVPRGPVSRGRPRPGDYDGRVPGRDSGGEYDDWGRKYPNGGRW